MLKKILKIIAVLIGIIIIGIIIILLLPEPKFKYTFDKDGVIVLKHPVKIETTPEKTWNFLINVENNYKSWHPKDHISFVWTNGKPWARGSTMDSEQYMGKDLVKYKGTVTESIPKEKITFEFDFPISMMNPKNEFIIQKDGEGTILTGVTYLKFNKVFRVIFKNQIDEMIESIENHTKPENENIKRILESL